MILGKGGYAYAMDGYVCCDTYVPPVQYMLNVGGDSSYTVQATARYNGVNTYTTGLGTAAKTLPVYAGSTVTAKLSNKSAGYRYNLSKSGLSATASSRDSAYTYITGIMTADGYVNTGTALTKNTFTASATEITVYRHQETVFADTIYGGYIFRASSCTQPYIISKESLSTQVKICADWYSGVSANKWIQTTTFAVPLYSAKFSFTADMPYTKTRTGTAYMDYVNEYYSANGQPHTYNLSGTHTTARTAHVTGSSQLPTDVPFTWWQTYSRNANTSSPGFLTADFSATAIITGVAY